MFEASVNERLAARCKARLLVSSQSHLHAAPPRRRVGGLQISRRSRLSRCSARHGGCRASVRGTTWKSPRVSSNMFRPSRWSARPKLRSTLPRQLGTAVATRSRDSLMRGKGYFSRPAIEGLAEGPSRDAFASPGIFSWPRVTAADPSCSVQVISHVDRRSPRRRRRSIPRLQRALPGAISLSGAFAFFLRRRGAVRNDKHRRGARGRQVESGSRQPGPERHARRSR